MDFIKWPKISDETFEQVLLQSRFERNKKGSIIEKFKERQPEIAKRLEHIESNVAVYGEHWLLAMAILQECLEIEQTKKISIILSPKPKKQ